MFKLSQSVRLHFVTLTQRSVLAILGRVSRKSRELFGPEKPVVKMQPACFKELIFELAFNVRKTKRTAKFDGLKP